MKTFEDLHFTISRNTISAKEFFNNGYGISVVRSKVTFTSVDILNFEIAVLKGTCNSYGVCYNTPITDDVIGYLTPKEVSKVMKEIQELPKIN